MHGAQPSLTHVGEITLAVLRLQVVQNSIPGFGKQIQLLQEPCLLPIHGVGTDDTGSELATIAQLKNKGGMLVRDGSRDGIFHCDAGFPR